LKILSQRLDLPAQPPDLAAWTRIYDLTHHYIHNTGEMKLPHDGCQGKDYPLYRFFESEGGYHRDSAFQRALLSRHFSETVASAYITAKATADAARTARWKAEREEAEQRLRPPGPPGIEWGGYIASGFGILLLIGLIYLLGRFKKQPEPPPPLTETHGKATFADPIFDMQ
jgi:hypothetical protein